MNKAFFAAATLSLIFSSSAFAHGACGHTELHGYMIGIKDELKLLSSDVKAGNNDEAAGRIDNIVGYLEKSHDVIPHQFSSDHLEGAQLEAKTAEYKKVLDDTIEVFNNLEVALASNDSAEVRKLFGQIGEQRNIGHRTFKEDC
ncbi:MAG: cytochrome b562 [Marinomonas sp.]